MHCRRNGGSLIFSIASSSAFFPTRLGRRRASVVIKLDVISWVLERNGDGVRTGLEDNIRITKHRLARSNAELVQMARETCAKYGRRPATPTEARALLRLEH